MREIVLPSSLDSRPDLFVPFTGTYNHGHRCYREGRHRIPVSAEMACHCSEQSDGQPSFSGKRQCVHSVITRTPLLSHSDQVVSFLEYD